MSELYSSAVPIFAPSLKFYQGFYDPTVMQFSLGWDRTITRWFKTIVKCDLNPMVEKWMRQNQTSYHPYSPNVDYLEDVESEMYWLQFSDFYDWPHVQHFDDYAHLKRLLLNANFTALSEAMKKELGLRKQQVTSGWCNVINNIQKSKRWK